MRRKALLLSAAWMVCYVTVYVVLSLNGAYVPIAFSNGPIWGWAPRFYPLDSPKPPVIAHLRAWDIVFGPLLYLDYRFWHDDGRRNGPHKVQGLPYEPKRQ